MIDKYKKVIIGLFFSCLVVVGLYIYRDYGVSWDEPIQRKYGEDVYNYITGRDEHLLKNKDRYYGPFFETMLLWGEKLVGFNNFKDIFQFRHLVTYIFFVVGVFFMFPLTTSILKDWKWGLLASLMLVMSPRIFAHSFYNSKDIPFMCAMIGTAYAIFKFKEKGTFSSAIIVGVTMAIATTIRLMGIFSIILLGLFLIDKVVSTDRKEWMTKIVVVIATYVVFTLAFWPTLWKNPLENFGNALEQMANYPQSTSMYYFGTKIKSTEVPWHYTLGWLTATTPFGYVILFIVGLVGTAYSIRKHNKNVVNILAILGWFALPLIAVIILKSNLYDSWRQMFFIYPAFVIIAVFGIKYFWDSTPKVLGYILVFLLFVSIANTGFQMIKEHPFQNVYFGALAGKKSLVEKRFELDYWGLSYKQAYDLISEVDARDSIVILAENFPGETNLNMTDHPERFTLTKHLQEADYYVTNYRGSIEKTYSNKPPDFSVSNRGLTLIGIYKIH